MRLRRGAGLARAVLMASWLTASWLVAPWLTAAAAEPPLPLGEFEVLSRMRAKVLAKQAQGQVPDGDGALGRNKLGYFSVRWQDGVTTQIIVGLLNQDPAALDLGVRGMEYAFAHQNPDGSFPIAVPAQYPGLRAYPQDYADAASFFFSELGRSLLLLRDSAWFQTADATAALRERVDALKLLADRSLTWLLTQQDVMLSADIPLSNHLYYDADGLYLVGLALARQDATEAALRFSDAGLNNQWLNGVLPENGGYDSSYQGVSLYRLCLLYLHADPANLDLRQSLWDAIASGVGWELTRILPTGEIDTSGNTRVFPGGDKILGVEKGVAYVSVVMALYYYSIVAPDRSVSAAADRVATFYTSRH